MFSIIPVPVQAPAITLHNPRCRDHPDVVHQHRGVEPDERDHGSEDHAIETDVVYPDGERLLRRPLTVDERNGLLDHAEEEEVDADLHDAVEERVCGNRGHERVGLTIPELEADRRGDDVEAEEAGKDQPEDGTVPGGKTGVIESGGRGAAGNEHTVLFSKLPAS